MLDNLKIYMHYGNLFCGIEQTNYKGKERFIVSVLKKHKKKLDIEHFFEADSLSALGSELKKQQPVFLVVNNENVITKCIDKKENYNLDRFVYSAFPNLNIDDFYYEALSQNNKIIISICRKTYLDNLVKNYISKGISIINIALDNNISSVVSSFINKDSIYTSNANILLKNKQIDAIDKIEVKEGVVNLNYNINGLQVGNRNLLSLSGALDLVVNNYTKETNFETLKDSLNNKYKQSRFFPLILKSALLLVLGILLINFFVFNHYFNKVHELKQTSRINQNTKENLIMLNDTVSKSQKMVEDMLKSNSSRSSFYVNALIQSLPKSILLSELNYQPLLRQLKKDKPVLIDLELIRISGISNNSKAFSNWVTKLEAHKWIYKIEIINYQDISNTKSKFSIELKLVDEQ